LKAAGKYIFRNLFNAPITPFRHCDILGGLLSSPTLRPMKRNFNIAVGTRFTDGLIIIISVVLLVVFLREPKPPKISIHQAAKDGNIETVKLDLADGTDVNAKDDNGRTPLHKAAEEGHKEIAELFIAAGAGVNAKNNLGGTPLHEAAASGHKEIAELLIAKDADVNVNMGGWTPLHLAADGGHTEIAELLIVKGADVNAKDKNGEKPLDGAEEVNQDDSPEVKAAKKETADLLRKHGAKTAKELQAAGK